MSVPPEDEAAVTSLLAHHGAAPVFISEDDVDGFYSGFSNSALWPLFHGFINRSAFSSATWDAYMKVNALFADEICKRAQPGDIVWVHDYQLTLVPELLRERGVTCPVGFFLHVPFPSSEIYRTLPVRENILRGLLGADFLGFHAYEYVSHFRKACLRVLGLDSDTDMIRTRARKVRLGVLPIGIDPNEIVEMAEAEEARRELKTLRHAYSGKKIILGVDRLDYTKGLPEKLLAYEELLRISPKWRKDSVLIQIAAPSRTNVDEYQALKRQVDELVGRINGRYGSSEHTPIVYINQSVSRTRLTGMYQAADVALVTPVRDGMNLVALEYIAARGELGGSLILSEFAGAAYLLPGARLVNPYNIAEVAAALEEELGRETYDPTHMLEFVKENTSMRWAQLFLDRLEEALEDPVPPPRRLQVTSDALRGALGQAAKPLILLDYDGTLRAYERNPSNAAPNERIRDVLRALSRRANVYVISGRDAATLEKWLGDLPIGLVCEHGFAMRPAAGVWSEQIGQDLAALERLQDVFDEFVRRTPGSRTERKRSAIAWHFRSADPEFGIFQSKELLNEIEELLKREPYSVLQGNKVIEVRHVNSTKGRAAEELLRRHPETDAVFCGGDDRTDEDMMEALRRVWGNSAVLCWVGGKNACADYWTESTLSLLQELEALCQLWGVFPGEVVAARSPLPDVIAGEGGRAVINQGATPQG